MADKLFNIKKMVEAMDGDFTAQLFGYEMNGQAIVEDIKWLLEETEKSKQVEKILCCGDYDEKAKLESINFLYFDE